MSLHQMTKEQRRQIAKRSEEILSKAPYIQLRELAGRFGITYSHLYNIRKEFGYRSLKSILGRKV